MGKTFRNFPMCRRSPRTVDGWWFGIGAPPPIAEDAPRLGGVMLLSPPPGLPARRAKIDTARVHQPQAAASPNPPSEADYHRGRGLADRIRCGAVARLLFIAALETQRGCDPPERETRLWWS